MCKARNILLIAAVVCPLLWCSLADTATAQSLEYRILVVVDQGAIALRQGMSKDSIQHVTFDSTALGQKMSQVQVRELEYAVPKYVSRP